VSLDSGGGEIGYAVAVQPNGKIVVGGTTSDGDDGVVYRLKPDGSRDGRFGRSGEVTLEVGGFDAALALGLTSGGRIAVAGHADGPTENALVLRLKGDGRRA
jgi:hypothetical protein